MSSPTVCAAADFNAAVIPNCEAGKYYIVPEGLKRLRTKKKVAIVFGYVGERYYGLQWNHRPEYPTIEEALLKALYETSMISMANFQSPKVQQLLNFERASRTDKGVHALCNVVSVNVMLPYHPAYAAAHRKEALETQPLKVDGTEQLQTLADDITAGEKSSSCGDTKVSQQDKSPHHEEGMFCCEEAKRLLNLALPWDIHVYEVTLVTRSFNAYMCCSGRRYEYYIPTFALMSTTDYKETYYPPDLAPTGPSLRDIGFIASGKARASRRVGDVTDEREEEDGVTAVGGTTDVSRGRRTKGHFPRKKKARQEAMMPVDRVEDVDSSTPTHCTKQHLVPDSAVSRPVGSSTASVEQKQPDADEGGISESSTEAHSLDLSVATATHFHDGVFQRMMLYRHIPEDAAQHVASYRLPQEQLARVRQLFRLFEGTHCYHNFTPGGSSGDSSCRRFIRSITVSDPFVIRSDDERICDAISLWSPSRYHTPDDGGDSAIECDKCPSAADTSQPSPPDGNTLGSSTAAQEEYKRQHMRNHLQRTYSHTGMEVVRIELDGQSFMLNQIRKMIGAVVCLLVSGKPSGALTDELLNKGVRRGIPMVPANGLFLSYLDFSGYNSRLHRIQDNGGNGAGKQGVHVDRMRDEVEAQRRRIVAVLLRNEMADDITSRWMRSMRQVLRLAWDVELL